MTGNSGSDFRIKLLIVHPGGRRQKFLVTFPERTTLKIDQRYIGLPITLRVDFVPGAIVCRPGTGHTLSVSGKQVKEHTVSVSDTIELDQYSFEFLELPEPLPIEAADEATRFVNINEVAEATVIAAMPRDNMEHTPAPQVPTPHAQGPHAPTPQVTVPPVVQTVTQGSFRSEPYTPDPSDSTAIIRRLQVPGGQATGQNTYSNYSTLQPAASSVPQADQTITQTTSPTGLVSDENSFGEEDGEISTQRAKISKRTFYAAVAAICLIGVYFALSSKDDSAVNKVATEQAGSTDLASEESATEKDELPATTNISESKNTRTNGNSNITTTTNDAAEASDPAVIPNADIPPAVPMASSGNSPTPNPFDDANGGFDQMAVSQFFDAVNAGDEVRIKEMVDKRVVDINLSRQRGYAALHYAAANGDLPTVKFLVKMRADVNVIDSNGGTPLMWAVFKRRDDIVKFLAPKSNLKIERQNGETAYAMAKRLRHTRYLRYLDPSPNKHLAKKASEKNRKPTSLPKKKK